MYYFWLAIVGIFDLAGSFTAKNWSLTKNPWYMVATAVLFALTGFAFAQSLQYRGVALTNITWVSLSAILVAMAGYFIYQEAISPESLFFSED